MAQTLFLPHPVMPGSIPSSPDPTPLRLLAFSVAEAALQSDPNSPSLSLHASSKSSFETDWFGPWSVSAIDDKPKKSPLGAEPRSLNGKLWDVVERAKERRNKTSSPEHIEGALTQTSPISPSTYKFDLPPNSPLAKSIATSPEKRPSPPRLSPAARQTLNARLQLSGLGKGNRPFPLYTRSAEPSPTKSTFSTLDQSRPPPVFVPRVGNETIGRSETESGQMSPTDRLRSQASKQSSPTSRHNARLPSLAQIQAKMAKSGHRRGSSVDGIPTIPSVPAVPRANLVYRTSSSESVEVLKTPTDELPPTQPRIVFDSPERRPATPPSPSGSAKESRLAPFLRERTCGRLAGGNGRGRPLSMPPLRGINVNTLSFGKSDAPSVTITPPKQTTRVKSQASIPPPSPSRSIVLNTPPRKTTSRFNYSSPSSPTESTVSYSTASPTLSVPIITCTPAPERFLKDGIEHDSDEEGGDVVLFEGDSNGGVCEKVERERRGKEMLQRLTLRRKSD